ncbi:MAG TPA: N-acetyl-alpha-D-glucosaminyl L-malate synthase BshA [Candidatus Kapabacteria bacterium]|nr:N-acetyl-alpha-D-glucosaminyl L-malate synthase BshA [Candidatus Kapabacteria bacterium]
MKIGITCFPTYGGSGVVATELGKELAARGHEVHFISYALPFRLDGFHQNIVFHEVELPDYPLFEDSLYSLSLTSKMVDVVLYDELDILHVHYAIPHASSAYNAKLILNEQGRDIKIITTLHGTDITLIGLDPTLLPLVRFSIDKSDGVTAVSRFLREKTLTNLGLDREVEVIPNFVNVDHWRPQDATRLREQFAPNGEKVLVHASNFRPVKRVVDVVRVFAQVREKVPAKLVMVGDGPDRAEAERLCRELEIVPDVRFLGKQDALPEILSASDIFLMPSQSESFGLSALEAMACGVPVLSSSVGGLPEVNVHGTTGYISEFGDIDRMARYAIELLTEPKRYARFSAAARDRAVRHFSSGDVVPMYERYYEKILAG